jgi:hypothetical protein
MDWLVEATHVVRNVRYAPRGRIYFIACGGRQIGDFEMDGPLPSAGPACGSCFAADGVGRGLAGA